MIEIIQQISGNNGLSFLIQTSFSLSILILIALAVRKPIAYFFGAQIAYCLWALPLLRLILPPIPENWSVLRSVWGTSQTEASILNINTQSALTPPNDASFNQEAALPMNTNADAFPAATIDSIIPALPFNWTLFIFVLWGLGSLLALIGLCLKQNTFMKHVHFQATPAAPSTLAKLESLKGVLRIKKRVNIIQTSHVSNPMVIGMLKPTILIPTNFERNFTSEEQNTNLTHELMHIKRGDLVALLLAHSVIVLQWMNPLVYIGLKRFRTDQEAACDSDILSQTHMTAHRYGATLVKAVKLAVPIKQVRVAPFQFMQPLTPALPLTHSIKERLLRMQTPIPSGMRKCTGAVMVGLLGAGTLTVTACTTPTASAETVKPISKTTSHRIYFDGKEAKNIGFLLLNDPMVAIEPKITELSTIKVIPPNVAAMPPMPPMDIMPPTPPTRPAGRYGALSDQEQQAFADEMEEFADSMVEFASEMEEFAELQVEQHIEMAALEAEIETQISGIMTEEFEQQIEESATALEALANQCVDETFSNGDIKILTKRVSFMKKNAAALCVNTAKYSLGSPEVRQFISTNKSLCKDLKETYLNSISQKTTYHFDNKK